MDQSRSFLIRTKRLKTYIYLQIAEELWGEEPKSVALAVEVLRSRVLGAWPRNLTRIVRVESNRIRRGLLQLVQGRVAATVRKPR